jgi:hypothetical protein
MAALVIAIKVPVVFIECSPCDWTDGPDESVRSGPEHDAAIERLAATPIHRIRHGTLLVANTGDPLMIIRGLDWFGAAGSTGRANASAPDERRQRYKTFLCGAGDDQVAADFVAD